MKLVIAEKPSVAKSIAKVLRAGGRQDGYLEGSGYLVSWCVGHLVELADASVYDKCYAKWTLADLPILPERWAYSVLPDTKKQFLILQKLMARADVTSLVCATDAGREGELIFRLVYSQTGCHKPVERLWISSMEDSAIEQGFRHLQPSKDYDQLYRAALCRAQADWLVGINGTRLFSVKHNHKLNVGRVVTPTLALITQREKAIADFKSAPFYIVQLEFKGFAASSDRLNDKEQAEALQQACAAAGSASIKTLEKKKKSEKPPALYDLTTLQREANRLLGMTAQQTLDTLQSLYEKKLATYPRTDSRYLTSDMANSLPELVMKTAEMLPFMAGAEITCTAGQVVNDSKVSDHHAVIPTKSAASADLSALSPKELAILQLISVRLICAVGKAYEYEETAVCLNCAGKEFSAKGQIILEPGWRALEKRLRDALRSELEPDDLDKKEKTLPPLSQGQVCKLQGVSVKEGKTTPPKHFTEDSLLAAMETASTDEMPEDAERKGLGTPATRAATVEKLIKSGFVERQKARKATWLLPTKEGEALIGLLPEELKSPLLTARWEQQLKEIEHGKADAAAFMAGISHMVRQLVEQYGTAPADTAAFQREIVGRCPRCGSAVVEIPKGFVCENRACKFAIWKASKFFAAKKKKPTKAFVSALLEHGKAKLTSCYSERTGKTYDATVVLDDDGGEFVNFRMEF